MRGLPCSEPLAGGLLGRLRSARPHARLEEGGPDATAAPASIECSIGSDTQGIRWVARFELEDDEGKVVRGHVPLHVGVERFSRPA